MTDAAATPPPAGEVGRLFHYHHHPHALAHLEGRAVPPKAVRDLARRDTLAHRINSAAALTITVAVGTMWCAYLFALIALLSLPSILHQVSPSTFSFFPSWLLTASLLSLIAWVSSYFLQLVLLPIIIVGQNLQAKASDQRAQSTYQDAEAVLHEAMQIQEHLGAQDAVLSRLIARMEELVAAAGGAPPPHEPA